LALVGIIAARLADRVSVQGVARFGLLFVIWLDAMTAGPRPNPTVLRAVYEPNLARRELKLEPSADIGQARVMLNAQAEAGLMMAPLTNAAEQVLYSRLSLYADVNLLDDIPKVVGMYSLYARESGEVLSRLWKSSEPPQGLADFLSVSHISSPGKATQWDVRKSSLPWATAGQKAILVDKSNTLAELESDRFDPRTTAYLRPEDQALVTVTNGSAARVLSSRWTPHRVDLEVEAPEPALVVIGQAFYPNWRAFVEGNPVPLLRANHAFQAVEIPAGRHHLELIYRDRTFYCGLTISLLSVAACFLFWFLTRRSDLRRPL
jgi:hypothetical protein